MVRERIVIEPCHGEFGTGDTNLVYKIGPVLRDGFVDLLLENPHQAIVSGTAHIAEALE